MSTTDKNERVDVPENELTLQDLFRMFRRRIKSFILILIVTLSVTAIYVIISSPVYESSVTIKLSTASSSSIASYLQDLPFAIGGSAAAGGITTEIEMILSRTNLEKVVTNLQLLDVLIPVESRNPEDTADTLLQSAAMALSDMVSVNPVKSTNIVEIKVEFVLPELCAAIANELARVYSDSLIEVSKEEAKEKLDFIATQLPLSKERLDTSIQKVRDFKEAKQVFLISEEAIALVEVVADFDKQLNQKKLELQTTQAALTVLREKIKTTDQKLISSETISLNPLVSELRSTLTNHNIELATLQKLYPVTDPRVLQKKRAIEETQNELSKQVTNIVTSQVKIDNPIYSTLMADLVAQEISYQLSASVIEALENSRKEYTAKLQQLPALEQQLTQLLRDQALNEEIYIALYKSYTEAQISEAGIKNRTYVVDKAIVPLFPTKPQKKLTVAIGGVLGIFLGILFVFLLEYMDKRVRDVEEIEKLGGYRLNLLGSIPESKKQVSFLEKLEPNSVFSESLQIVTTNLNVAMDAKSGKTCMITSANKADGASTIAFFIAHTLAQEGERVLLLDGNFRHPTLSKMFRLPESSKGVAELFSENNPENVSVVAIRPNLDFLPTGNVSTHPLSIFRGKRFEDWLQGMKKKYTRILIDTPAISESADASLIAARCDGSVLIITLQKTQKKSAKQALSFLEAGSFRESTELQRGLSTAIGDVAGQVYGVILNGVAEKEIPLLGYMNSFKKPKAFLSATNRAKKK